MRVIEFLKRVIRKMMPIKDDLHLELAVSNTMINAINGKDGKCSGFFSAGGTFGAKRQRPGGLP